ncbi:MAG: DedD protein [Candidatus Endobugula sp.]
MDNKVKQRLVGVLVLISFAIIFLPSLFYREQRISLDTTTLIPPKPKVKAIVISPPVNPKGFKPAPSPEKAFQPPVVAKTSASVKSSKTQSIPQPTLNKNGLPNAWVIQVGSFKSQVRADEFKDKLLKQGHKAYSRSVNTTKGQYFRVFIGPYIDKSRALLSKKTVDKAYKVASQVLTFAPE